VLNTQGRIFSQLRKYNEAEKAFLKAIEIEAEWSVPYRNLAFLYLLKGDFVNSEPMANKAIELNSKELRAIQILAWNYIYTDRMDQAGKLLHSALQMDEQNHFDLNFDLSCYYSLKKDTGNAFKHIEEALKLGYKDYKRLQSDADLEILRQKTKKWKCLMKKYFPEQAKTE
jgi:tetratricopeptide (TPR) repeat protein